MSDETGAAMTVVIHDGAAISSRIANGPDGPRAVLSIGQIDVHIGASVLTAVVRESARAQHTLGIMERGARLPG